MEAAEELRLPEHLDHDGVVRRQFAGLLCHDFGLGEALLVDEPLELVDLQSDLLLDFDLQPLLPLDVLPNAIVLVGQLDLRTVLIDDLLGFRDGAIDAAQQLIAACAVQAGRFDLLSGLLQHCQRALRIGCPHRPRVRFAMCQLGRDLANEQLLLGGRLVGQARPLPRLLRPHSRRRGEQLQMILKALCRDGIQFVRVSGGLTEQFISAGRIVGPQRRLTLLE